MRTRNIWAGATALALVAASVLLPSLAANAHDKAAGQDCDSASVALTNYDRGATALIVLDGVTLHEGTFGGRLVQSWPQSGNTEHTFTVTVRSEDGERYNLDYSSTTSGCYTPPPVEPTIVTATFLPTDAVCVGTEAGANSAVLTLGEGVTATYSLNGEERGAVASGTYGADAVVPGTYVITATAPPGAEFAGDVTTLTFTHTFPAVPTDCAPPVEEPVIEQHAESTCTSTTVYTTRTWTTTDGVVSNEQTTTRELERAEAIELGCYTPPVVECPEGTTPGWLNEHGDPTSCVGDDPCPETVEDGCPPPVTPPTEPPVVTTSTLAHAGDEGLTYGAVALSLLLAGIALVLVRKRRVS